MSTADCLVPTADKEKTMAVNIRELFPLQQAKVRRSQLARYAEALEAEGYDKYLKAAAL